MFRQNMRILLLWLWCCPFQLTFVCIHTHDGRSVYRYICMSWHIFSHNISRGRFHYSFLHENQDCILLNFKIDLHGYRIFFSYIYFFLSFMSFQKIVFLMVSFLAFFQIAFLFLPFIHIKKRSNKIPILILSCTIWNTRIRTIIKVRYISLPTHILFFSWKP